MRCNKKFTTRVLPILFCLMAILLVACGGGSSPSSPQAVQKASPDKQVFVYPQEGIQDIQTFDPALSTDLESITAIDLVYTGLVQLDDKLNVRGQLASSWNLASDGLTWTFHLKPNLKFSDGTPLTSKDVAYSIDRALQPAVKSTISLTYLALIKDSDKLANGKVKTIINDSIMTPDDNTVVLVANKKASYFLDALTYSTSYVVEKSLIDKYGNTKFTDHLTEGGSAGPFVVTEYTHNKQIVFAPNPNYYGPKPQLQKIVMPFYSTVDTGYKAYQVGQVDYSGIPSANYEQASALSNQFHKTPVLGIRYYTMNYLVKPFDNIHIRQAFDLALNKNEIVHAVWKDRHTPSNHIIPSGMPGYNPNLKGPDGTQSTAGNPAKAKQLLQQGLQEEGYASVSQLPPIKFTYNTGSKTADNEVAAAIQMWQSVLGVNIKLEAVDFNKLLDEITATTNNNRLQMWRIDWYADYPDAQDWLTLQFDKGAQDNNLNYGQNNSPDASQQQALQQLMEQADTNPDQASRLQQYNQAEQQLINDVAWLPVYQFNDTELLKPYVQGYVFNAGLLVPPDDWANIYISAH